MERCAVFLVLAALLAYAQSAQKEMAAGRQMAEELEKHTTVVTDAVIQEYVDRIAQKVAAPAGLGAPLTVKVIVESEGYATTLPGGFCFVHSGLIQAAASEAELAGVIAHQAGHLAVWREKGSVGFCLRGTARPVIPVGMLASQAESETQADLRALGYLEKAGYDPRALADFFERALRPGSVSRVFAAGATVAASTRAQAETMAGTRSWTVNTSEFVEIQRRSAEWLPKAPVKVPSLFAGR